MGFFASLIIRIKGFFLKAGDDLVSGSPEAIQATYRTIEDKEIQRYNQMLDAVSSLARQREDALRQMERLQGRIEELNDETEGALALADSEPDNKEQHREAYNRAFAQKEQLQARLDQTDAKADQLTEKVEDYKLELSNFQSRIEELKQEGDESVADLISSQSIIQIEQRLQGLSTDSTDQALTAVRRKVADTKAKAQITAELGGVDVARQRQRYRAAAKQSAGGTAFDEMLKQRQQGKAEAESETQEASEQRKLGE